MVLLSLNPRVIGTSKAALSCTRALRPSSRSFQSSARILAPTFATNQQPPVTSQSRQTTRSAHAISNPTLAGIEKRWEAMPPQEQAELWMQLRDRMKVPWTEMTLQEKKAGMSISTSWSKTCSYFKMDWLTCAFTAWWIAFGPHGPRAEDPPGEWTKIWLYTAVGCIVSGVLFFGIHAFARPPPRTMTKEWQEATNEYLKVRIIGCFLYRCYLTYYR